MPYIKQARRKKLDPKFMSLIEHIEYNDITAGDLNYIITRIIYAIWHRGSNYETINSIVGALDCAKLEFYRRIAAPYEDIKIEENGNVY